MTTESKATLVLEDGTVFHGRSFGAQGEAAAEIIFHTGMTGYQEVLTDPSYCGQMVIMTYPLIGNYGVNELDEESGKPWVSGFIVKEASRIVSNWRSSESLHDYLARHGVVGIEGIDTRAAVLHVRSQGAMRAVISTQRDDVKALQAAALASPRMEGQNLVDRVSATEAFDYRADSRIAELEQVIGGILTAPSPQDDNDTSRPLVVAYDFGAKRNILTLLAKQGFRVRVVPAHTSASETMAMKPNGVFLSNGPGDPAALPGIFGTVRELIGKVPIFGICLGHQLLGLALGATTYKLKFGHHGANHPVRDLVTGKVEITSQNHGFCVDAAALPPSSSVTHLNLNDGTVEGFEDEANSLFAVQYHPEAAPGPHDSNYLFSRFKERVARG
jgi:carbamoyl-phosphate synthase small subunit